MPIFHSDDVVDSAPPPKNPTPSPDKDAPRKPPPGLGHSAYRGFVSTMAGLDQTVGNLATGLSRALPGQPTGFIAQLGKDATAEAERRRQELEQDTAAGGAPQTTGEKRVEGVVRTAGGAIPYLATDGPIGAGVVGALENADRGPVEAIKAGVKTAAFSKAAGYVGKGLSKVGEKASKVSPTLANAVPSVVKRGATGAATAALLAPPGEGANQAIVGGLAGASQRQTKDPNQVRAAKLQAATGKTGENAWESYKVVGPRLEETASLTGKQPKTVNDLLENVQATGKRLNQEFEGYLAPIQNQNVFGQSIAKAIRDKIYTVEVNGKTAEEEKTGNAMEARAKEFEKGFTLRELDNLRQIYFERLNGNSKETLKERGNGDIRADRAAEEAIKDLEYNLVDQQAQAAGKPAGYVRGTLKTQQAHLIQIKDALLKRTKALGEKEGIEAGTPAMQQADATLALHPGGGAVGSLHGIWKKIWGDPDSYKEANKRVATSFPVKTSTPPNRVAAVVASARSRTGQPPPGTNPPEAPPAAPQAPQTVKMKAPDGSTRDVPASEVDHWKTKGAVVTQ